MKQPKKQTRKQKPTVKYSVGADRKTILINGKPPKKNYLRGQFFKSTPEQN